MPSEPTIERVAAAAVFLAVLSIAGAGLSGCTGPSAFIRDGGPDTVDISYRGDVANAMALARRHCAQFERVPQLVRAEHGLAVFECRRP
jgi:hypothetical protein